MPCILSKPVEAASATPTLAVCALETPKDPSNHSPPLSSENGTQQQTVPDGLGSRLSVLFPLFRRCCPRKTVKRLITAGSALVLCSSCNLMTPTLLGVAVDAAAASHQKASSGAGAVISAVANRTATTAAADRGLSTWVATTATDAAAAAARLPSAAKIATSHLKAGGGAGLLKEIWHALCVLFSGGGRAALQQQPPRVLFALVCGVVLLGAAMSWLRTTQLEFAEQEMRAETRRQLFSAVLYAPPSFLLGRTNPGLLLPLFREDTDILVAAFSSTQAQALRYCSSVFGGSTLLLLLSPRLTAVALVLLPLAGCSAMLLAKRQRALQRERDAVWQRCNALLADRLLHMPTVYIHQEQDQEEYRFERQQQQLLATAKRAAFANGFFYGGLSFLVNSTVVALLVLGTKLVASGAMTQGSLTTFAVYSSMVGVGCSGLAALSGDLARAAAAGARLNAVFAAAAAAGSGAGCRPIFPVGGAASGGDAESKSVKKNESEKSKGKTILQVPATSTNVEEKTAQQEITQQQQSDKCDTADTSALQPLLQQLAQGQLTAGEVVRRMKGEIQFHNVTYLYKEEAHSNAAPAAATALGDVEQSSHIDVMAKVREGNGESVVLEDRAETQRRLQQESRGLRVADVEGARADGNKAAAEKDTHDGGGVRDINIVISAGCITGIAGASGSGKSTLLKLLTKQLKPQTGKITLDGTDIQSIPTRVLLQQLLGVVNADSIALLSGLSLRENILYGVWTPRQQHHSHSSNSITEIGSEISTTVKQHVTETFHPFHAAHSAAVRAAAAVPGISPSCGCPFARAIPAAKRMLFSGLFSSSAPPTEAQLPAPCATAANHPAGGAAAAFTLGGDPGASFEGAAQSQEQKLQHHKEELLFREACRLCNINEFLQRRGCPYSSTTSSSHSSHGAACAGSPVTTDAKGASTSSPLDGNSTTTEETRRDDRHSAYGGGEETIAATALSSGELQRLGIARAIVKQPAVLLLDEATAHLDERNERMLLTTLRKLVSAYKKASHMQQMLGDSSSSSSVKNISEKLSNSSSSSSSISSSGISSEIQEKNEKSADGKQDIKGEVSNTEKSSLSPPLEAVTRTATPGSDVASPGRERHEEEQPTAANLSEVAAAATQKKMNDAEVLDGETEEKEGSEGKKKSQQDESSSLLLLEGGVRTILLIAHSKQALKLADKVIVLKEGRVVEEGPYDELLQRKGGELVRLVHQQQEAEEEQE